MGKVSEIRGNIRQIIFLACEHKEKIATGLVGLPAIIGCKECNGKLRFWRFT